MDRKVGSGSLSFTCRLYVPKEYGRIALSWAKMLEESEGSEPDFVTLQIPEWGETRIRILPEKGITYALGSDYTGEAKKSFLRLFMYYAKKEEGLGLHAGSKRLRIRREGGLTEVGQLFLGLSATGKSTLTAHGLFLDEPENAEMVQDDVCALLPDGEVPGSEGKGLYVKTIGLKREEQPELFDAATQPHAVLENVDVSCEGEVDFSSDRYTTNSRATILREDLPSASEDIVLDGVDQVFFITRNPLMPPVAKLSREEGAAAFMLGESIQTAAGDPEHAGEAIRVVGTNPFIVGSKGEEGNRFYELIEKNDVECFLLNTGYIGEGRKKEIGVEDTVKILKAVSRRALEWKNDEKLGLDVPEEVPGLGINEFYPPSIVEGFEEKVSKLRKERKAYLEKFGKLDRKIRSSYY